MSLPDHDALRAGWIERQLQLKSDFIAAGHRQALRQRVNRCWDLLQQQHRQQYEGLKKNALKNPLGTGLGE